MQSSSVNAITSPRASMTARLRAQSRPGLGSRMYRTPANRSRTKRSVASVLGALSTTRISSGTWSSRIKASRQTARSAGRSRVQTATVTVGSRFS